MKVIPKRDPPLALNHLRETVGSAGYKIIADRLQFMLHQERNQHEDGDLDWEKTWKARGYIRAIKAVQDLPEILKRELLSASQKPPTS